MTHNYCDNYICYHRWKTREVTIGNIKIGGNNPICLQSMSSCNPMDTKSNVEQAIRIINAGGEMVRFTAPSVKDALNLKNISEGLRKQGYTTPLIADIHFNPKAALAAADFVEKIRINPGNFAEISTQESNSDEENYITAINHIEKQFVFLLEKCKEKNIAIRIGSNHGSLSQRVMNKYGNSPKGMVEAAMEFLRIAIKHNFYNIVVSMKASNIRVMVQAYRLLSATMREENMNFPLHIGVTEAGMSDDGRIKSAAGIGALLEDGLGDTIRVSLTEDPEFEIPVAKIIANRYKNRKSENEPSLTNLYYNPYKFERRKSINVANIGNTEEISILDFDIEVENKFQKELSKQIISVENWNSEMKNAFPLMNLDNYLDNSKLYNITFIEVKDSDFTSNKIQNLKGNEKVVLIFTDLKINSVHTFRKMFIYLSENNIKLPVIIKKEYSTFSEEELKINAAIDFGSLLVDGLGDAIWIKTNIISKDKKNELALTILQACRSRIYKTDFISCPSCGRTLFNIQEATNKIISKTAHLKNLKIAIMGCVVNGPGEMADADYGYVGSMVGQINLYKGQNVIRKGIPQEEAVEALIDLIKSNGDWVEPSVV